MGGAYDCAVYFSTAEQQLERLMERDNLSQDEALKRISAQMPLKEKCNRANFVIGNSGDIKFTEQQTYTLYHTMRRSSSYCGLYRWILIAVVFYLMYKFFY